MTADPADLAARMTQCPDCGMTVEAPCSHPRCRYRLTPLGLSVRAIIAKEAGHE